MNTASDSCRICTSNKIDFMKRLDVNSPGQIFDIFECHSCGSRFTWRKNDVFERMHATDNSPYSFHSDIASEIIKLFQKQKIGEIKKYLSRTAKYKFIIDHIPKTSKKIKILELGSSLGYLTFYFILEGYQIIGADISKTAVKKAISNFGNYFVLIDNDFFNQGECYDIIYHVGTIGCVEKPIEFIHKNLSLLHPGGRLFFNAPDVQAIKEKKAVWSDSALPPDLITMFDKKIWSKYFNDVAEVKIRYKPYSHANNAKNHIERLIVRLEENSYTKDCSNLIFHKKSLGFLLCEKNYSLLLRLYYYLSYYNLIRKYKDDFGMYITMTKN